MTGPLAWSHRVTEIPEAGLEMSRTATPAELAVIAQTLDIPSCEALRVDYRISALGRGRYRMSGQLSARVTQSCVVTLEPVPSHLKESFDVAFWPEGSLPEADEAEVEALSLPEVEPIENGFMPVGRVFYDVLAATLDPYPRKPGAHFEWEEGDDAEGEMESGPFAVLKKLKDGT
jgi:uncharacterized metal-binding protein YceD (DUF177 family)